MADSLMVPPIRTALINNPDGSPLTQTGSSNGGPLSTEKAWYYYWRDTGRRINATTDKVNTLVTDGLHADRPDPANMPDGALYVESDRGVLYYNYQGEWHYLAGTMWGTITPDQRPTDLGPHDAGFDFRTNVNPQREFMWSGSAWIEVENSTYEVNGALIGSRNTLNLIPGANITLGGVDNAASNRVDVTISGTGQTPWSSNIDGAGHTLSNVGQIGIGTATPGCALDAIGSGGLPNVPGSGVLRAGIAGGFGNILDIGCMNTSPYAVWLQSTDRGSPTGAAYALLLQPIGGSVGIGTTNPPYQLTLSADSAAKPSTNTWTIASDIRTKRHVNRFEGDIEVIRKLDPIVAEYNGLGGTPEGARVVSFDAAKLREIVPQCVSSTKGKLRASDAEETELLGVNTHELFFHLLRAVQQIDRRLAALEKKKP